MKNWGILDGEIGVEGIGTGLMMGKGDQQKIMRPLLS